MRACNRRDSCARAHRCISVDPLARPCSAFLIGGLDVLGQVGISSITLGELAFEAEKLTHSVAELPLLWRRIELLGELLWLHDWTQRCKMITADTPGAPYT
jgi:hypothetical protein